MSEDFDQEWSRLRGKAPGGPVSTRLNGIPAEPGGSGGSGVFGSTPAEKTAAANTIETELEPNTRTATDFADEATGTAAKGFDGWDTAAGLKKVADTWDQQVKTLMGRLSAEKNSLRGASGLFVRNDIGTGDRIRANAGLSKLNGI